ncbi:MAG: tetratricopeptide repeat protein [Brevinematales bacterium]|nr:tetratricopeptide repeat protein [Brevinematales bacterium]
MKNLFALFFLFCFTFSFSFEDFWGERNSPEGAKKAFETTKQEFSKNPDDFEVLWKLARISHFYADNFVKDKEEKKKVLDLGKTAAEKASSLKPESPEGWYWLAVCLGSWGEANGIMQSLSAVKPIMEACNKGIKINPEFEKGNFYMVRGRVFHKAPSVISVGDIKKAIADYEKAITLNPENRTAHRFYAELLIEQNNKEKAKEIIDRGLNIPINKDNILVESKEIKILTKLKEKFN